MMLQHGVHTSDPPSLAALTCHLHVPKWGRQSIFSSPKKLQRPVLYPWFSFQALPKNHYCYMLLCRNVACSSSLVFLSEKYRGEKVIPSLSTGHVLSRSPAACSWFSLSEDFGWAAAIITQLGSGKSRPVADACLIAAGCVRRLQDLL